MFSLVDVILKYVKEDQEEAWRQIDEACVEIKTIAAVEAARFYHQMPFSHFSHSISSHTSELYPAMYPPVYLPAAAAVGMYPTAVGLTTAATLRSSPPPHSPLNISRPRSRCLLSCCRFYLNVGHTPSAPTLNYVSASDRESKK